MNSVLKTAAIIILITAANNKDAFSQTFFESYKQYLIKKGTGKQDKNKLNNWANEYLNRFKATFDTVQRRTGVKMLARDTLYMISTYNESSYDISWLIWNDKHSCYYQYNAAEAQVKQKHSDIRIDENAANKLMGIELDFKATVERADTLNFQGYIRLHPLPKYCYKSFVVAIRSHKKWRFITSKTYGSSALKDKS